MSQLIRNGQGLEIPVPAGQSLRIASITGTYSASIVAGAGIGVLATNSNAGATYGPYAAGVVIRISCSEGGISDWAVGTPATLDYKPVAHLGIDPATGDATGVVDPVGSSVGSGSSTTIAYSTSIPFTYAQADMGVSYVSGAVTLTAVTAGATRGSSCLVTLVANGTNAPVLSGMVAADSDRGYVNTLGVVNTLWMWYDGLKYYYQWSQDASQAPIDTTPPTLSSATAIEGFSTIVLAFNETLSSTLTGSVTLGGPARTVVAQEVVGNVVRITVSSPYAFGDAPTVTYASGYVKDAGLNPAAAATAQAVTVTSSNIAVRIGSLSGLTESGDGTAGWNYIGTTAGYATGYGVSTLTFPANSEASVRWTQPASTAVSLGILGLRATNTASDYNGYLYGEQPITSGSNRYLALTSGVSGAPNGASITPAFNHVVQLRRMYVASAWVIYLEVSSDGGANFTLVHTFSGVTSAALYIAVNNTNNGAMRNIRGAGLA